MIINFLILYALLVLFYLSYLYSSNLEYGYGSDSVNIMKTSTYIKRDILVLVVVILLWMFMSIPTTGDKPHIRIIISLIFLIPVLYQTSRIIKKVKAQKQDERENKK